jgi:AcrR family transcriptional regulator
MCNEMPKRDQKYMKAKSAAVARGAITALFEKGYHGATSREICQAAGISNGALYTHFPTRAAVVVAAGELLQADRLDDRLPESWSDYVDGLPWGKRHAVDRTKSFCLEVEFITDVARTGSRPEGMREVLAAYREDMRRRLRHLREIGIVSLPFGVDKTAELHSQLSFGAQFSIHMDPDCNPEAILETLAEGLASTAGLITDQVRPAGLHGA